MPRGKSAVPLDSNFGIRATLLCWATRPSLAFVIGQDWFAPLLMFERRTGNWRAVAYGAEAGRCRSISPTGTCSSSKGSSCSSICGFDCDWMVGWRADPDVPTGSVSGTLCGTNEEALFAEIRCDPSRGGRGSLWPSELAGVPWDI